MRGSRHMPKKDVAPNPAFAIRRPGVERNDIEAECREMAKKFTEVAMRFVVASEEITLGENKIDSAFFQ